MTAKSYIYSGYCRNCQKYVLFQYMRKLNVQEIHKWRKCYYCGEYGIFGLTLAEVKD